MSTQVMSQTSVINFAVCGDVRSGSSVIQSAISNLRGAVCHCNLLHEDERVRIAEHERYFGPSAVPEWYQPELFSPWQYINHQVYDNPKNGEKSVGLRLPYNRVHALELYDLLHDRCIEGDFGLVHVVRNPVACYVSLQQAKMTGVWSRSLDDKAKSDIPPPVVIVPADLVQFVRQHAAIRGKLERACDDVLVVHYRDLLLNFQPTMAKVFDFIEIETRERAMPSCRRLRNRSMRERISNFDELKSVLPHDVRYELVSEDLC